MTMCPSPALRREPEAVKVPVPDEQAEQVAFVNWFRFAHPKVLLYAIPNGAHMAGTAKQRAAQMARFKAAGLFPGIPDLHIPAWSTWVEMKRADGGRLSVAQREVIAHLTAIGQSVIVAHGWQDAKDKLTHLISTGEVRP